jgi:hypothetical protein
VLVLIEKVAFLIQKVLFAVPEPSVFNGSRLPKLSKLFKLIKLLLMMDLIGWIWIKVSRTPP